MYEVMLTCLAAASGFLASNLDEPPAYSAQETLTIASFLMENGEVELLMAKLMLPDERDRFREYLNPENWADVTAKMARNASETRVRLPASSVIEYAQDGQKMTAFLFKEPLRGRWGVRLVFMDGSWRVSNEMYDRSEAMQLLEEFESRGSAHRE